ncbi:MAG TPA: hypothetical protein VJ976_03130 [Ornithinimicrobium sp.]|uniref:hypothetical protein n=1 Tax=Ornithinimicrobium sp. TaxID=1977084 RepID=UPI002B493A67|nr:hypothetical protein [Ornithinimicrobium sp.]HKJ11362.1 hypothetical protein [Ornithinimicrobium sp.]
MNTSSASGTDSSQAQVPSQTPHDGAEGSENAAGPPGDDAASGARVSEAGGASLNEETSEGGADAVPDTHG